MKNINFHKKFIERKKEMCSVIDSENLKDLQTKGYTILNTNKNFWIKNKIDFDYLEKKFTELCNQEGESGGWENGKSKMKRWEPSANRVSNLPNKDDIFLKLASVPDIILGVNSVIKKPFKLSSMQIRDPIPFGDKQDLHIDFRPRLFNYYNYNQCTAFIYLDDANISNGSLHIYPGTHKLLGEPSRKRIEENAIRLNVIDIKKYNIVILNVYCWHYGGENLNGRKRRTIFINYRERSEIQQLNQKKFLDESIKSKMSLSEKYLYGVRDEDPNQSDWIYKNRNHKLVKSYQVIRDIIYHKYLSYI